MTYCASSVPGTQWELRKDVQKAERPVRRAQAAVPSPLPPPAHPCAGPQLQPLVFGPRNEWRAGGLVPLALCICRTFSFSQNDEGRLL